MNKFQLASRMFLQTILRLRKGKQGSSHVVLGLDRELLTQTEDTVRQWKKPFLDVSSMSPLRSL